MTIAKRSALVGRVLVSYLFGLVCGSMIWIILSPAPAPEVITGFTFFVLAGAIFSWPIALALLLLTFLFAGPIASRPVLWTAAAVAIVIVVSWTTLPLDGQLAAPTAIVAVFAGVCFLSWALLGRREPERSAP
ncbi:MAG: hypothetical protein AB7O56_06745 [Bauldia sp.]